MTRHDQVFDQYRVRRQALLDGVCSERFDLAQGSLFRRQRIAWPDVRRGIAGQQFDEGARALRVPE